MSLNFSSIFLAFALSISFSACSNNTKIPDYQITSCIQDGIDAPKWTCVPTDIIDGFYSDLGSAPFSKFGADFTRKQAIASARSNLSLQINTSIKDKIETFSRSTGLEFKFTNDKVSPDNVIADKVSTHISKQLTQVSLSDSKQISFWQHPENKTIYVLIKVDKKSINLDFKKAKTEVLKLKAKEARKARSKEEKLAKKIKEAKIKKAKKVAAKNFNEAMSYYKNSQNHSYTGNGYNLNNINF